MARSIAAAGLLQPPVLQERPDGAFRIVSGFRRVAACRELGWEGMPARVFGPDADPGELALMAAWENAVLREPDPMEQARMLRLLSRTLGMERAGEFFSQAFGAQAGARHLEKIMSLCELPQAVQDAVAEGAVAFPMARQLAELAPRDAESLARLFSDLRLSLGKQRQVFTLCCETARRDGRSPGEVLFKTLEALKEKFPEADRGLLSRLTREELFRRRYPEYSRARDLRDESIRSLGLPKDMSWQPPEFFEGVEHRILLRASSPGDLARLKGELEEILANPEIEKLFS